MTTYAGFDIDVFPGLDVMRQLKETTNLVWCVHYLEAPSHQESGWTGHRSLLVRLGYDVLPVFVGQQITGPGSHKASAAQGLSDAFAAEQRLLADTFPERTVCALDIESGPPFAGLIADYAVSWCERLATYGYTPGIYCSHLMAAEVARLIPEAKLFIYQVPTLAPTHATAPFETPEMSRFSWPQAIACQHRQNVRIAVGGHTLTVDLDVAASAEQSRVAIPAPQGAA